MQVTRTITVWLQSIEKSRFTFCKKNFRFCNWTQNTKMDFRNREIRPQGRFQLTNPHPDFMDFLLYCSIGKSERGFAKILFWTVVFFLLIMHAGAKLLFLRTVFLNPFLDIPKKNNSKKREKSRTEISAALKSKSRFPNHRHPLKL